MDVKRIFDVFSRRHSQTTKANISLTDSFRQRVLMLCREVFLNVDGRMDDFSYKKFWEEIHKRLRFLIGNMRLSNDPSARSISEDAVSFLLGCPNEHFLDFIEYIFQVDAYGRVRRVEDKLVDEINHLFQIDQLPYALTPIARKNKVEIIEGRVWEGDFYITYPKIISRENEFEYSSLIQPAIKLLLDEGFSSANKEFIEALEDYRKGDYGDCLTKCASSLESTMKIICARNQWAYSDSDTASKLLGIVIEKSKLDSYFEQPLIIISTIRNRLSKSHGSGIQLREVPLSKVKFAINATASAIILLVEHCREYDN